MRLLLLISTIAIGASLLSASGSALAASVAKPIKSTHAGGRVLKGYSKAKGHVKQKELYPGDVWKRIGSGLRLPRPSLEQAALAEQMKARAELTQAAVEDSHDVSPLPLDKLSATISPESASDPMLMPALDPQTSTVKSNRLYTPATVRLPKNNYTALGRRVLGKTTSQSSKDCEPDKNGLNNYGAKRAVQTRVHAQFNFHNELHKHTVFNSSSVGNLESNDIGTLKRSTCAENSALKLARLAKALPDDSVSAPVLDIRMRMLANKQRMLAAQRDAAPKQNPATGNQTAQDFDAQMQLLAAKLAVNNERVNKYVNWYAQRRDYLYEVAERARPYLYHIVEGLSSHHLPLDLALLPIVESAYQPTAQSPMSAAGLWQFIPSTGADYSLKQDIHYDERLDITASTQAAVSYLTFLNQRFKGDWLLALAAYNCGIGRVEDAISRNVAAGLDADYWSLPLPEETQAYVPRLLALATLFENPATYQLKLLPVRNEPYFINVKIDRKLDIKNLADKDIKSIAGLANINYEQFSLLNPGYLKAFLPPDRPFNFLMPIANANQLHRHLTMFATMGKKTQDNNQLLLPVSTALNETAANNWSKFSNAFLSLQVGSDIQPIASGAVAKVADNAAHNHQPKSPKEDYLAVHYVDKGETLQTLARQFDVNIEEIRKLNKLKRRQAVVLGQRLTIPPKRISTIMLASK
ncbi:MAG: transglycosylase SLT domain-containing protein [Methylococcales bacterium]